MPLGHTNKLVCPKTMSLNLGFRAAYNLEHRVTVSKVNDMVPPRFHGDGKNSMHAPVSLFILIGDEYLLAFSGLTEAGVAVPAQRGYLKCRWGCACPSMPFYRGEGRR